MLYTSTRNNKIRVTAAQAIAQGISEEGGLFVPVELPHFSMDTVREMMEMSYIDRAKTVLRTFLTDFSDEELNYCVEGAYRADKFSSPAVAPTVNIGGKENILELWHGPTCAFKDMALQILPYLLTTSAKKTIDGKKISILVATSGDTGKAALEGFKDVDGTSIMVFYPEDGVSNMQKRQMTTQEGSNVNVCAVVGNFDDCQSGVKQIFTDKSVIAQLEKANTVFSSANSINWGRLAPQIIYYVSSYVQLVKDGELKYGEKLNVVVPTGNFGNILAAYYAKQMGIPIGKLICASNANNVLTDFINTGIYDRNRKFYTTVSPSMDILISSNLERLLYHLTGEDDKLINEWFTALKNDGRYEVNDSVKAAIKENFYAGCCDDEQTKGAIKEVFDEYSYLMDTHTAVAYKVYEDYKKKTGDNTKTLIASTANPYKFGFAVYDALGGETEGVDEFELIGKLEKLTKTTCPKALSDTKNKPVRFTGSIKPEEMAEAVLEFINK